MSKDLTPLEALKKIKDNMAYQIQLRGDCVIVPEFDIIETALKDYEKKSKVLDDLKNNYMFVEPDEFFKTMKKLEVLRILKRTKIDIDWFVSSFIKQDADYNVFLMLLEEMGTDGHLAEQLMMSKEQFDLLKEVLK